MRRRQRPPKGPRHISEFSAEALADVAVRMKARRLFEQGDMAIIEFIANLARDPDFGAAVTETLAWHLGSDDVGGRHRGAKTRPQNVSPGRD